MNRIKFLIIVLTLSVFFLTPSTQFISATEINKNAQKKDAGTVVVYYFHGNFRCYNCMTIEQYSQVDYAGRVIKEPQQISVTLGDWLTNTHELERRYAYDEAGRQTHVLDIYLDTDGTSLQSGQRAMYNAFGEVTEERRVGALPARRWKR